MSILEDLWFDNLVVQDTEIRKGSEQEKALAASVRYEDALRETLTEKLKEQFALCGERRNELLTVFEKEAFIHGFKLGTIYCTMRSTQRQSEEKLFRNPLAATIILIY